MDHRKLYDLCHDSLVYDPCTGKLIWKIARSRNIKVGDEAGGDTEGRRRMRIDGKHYWSHRIAFLMYHGYLPRFIDHKNGIPNDNRIANLRACTKAQNSRNSKPRSNNKSGFKGVCFKKSLKKWQASITIDKKQKHIGYFFDKIEAAKAYNQAAIDLHGEFAWLNSITKVV